MNESRQASGVDGSSIGRVGLVAVVLVWKLLSVYYSNKWCTWDEYCTRVRKEFRDFMCKKSKQENNSIKTRPVVSHLLLKLQSESEAAALSTTICRIPSLRSEPLIRCPFQQLKRIHALEKGNKLEPPRGRTNFETLPDVILTPLTVTFPIYLKCAMIV